MLPSFRTVRVKATSGWLSSRLQTAQERPALFSANSNNIRSSSRSSGTSECKAMSESLIGPSSRHFFRAPLFVQCEVSGSVLSRHCSSYAALVVSTEGRARPMSTRHFRISASTRLRKILPRLADGNQARSFRMYCSMSWKTSGLVSITCLPSSSTGAKACPQKTSASSEPSIRVSVLSSVSITFPPTFSWTLVAKSLSLL